MSDNGWNKKECPQCGAQLTSKDLSRIAKQAQRTAQDSLSLTKPEGWWQLSCGHRVESLTHSTHEGFNFQLIDRPPREED